MRHLAELHGQVHTRGGTWLHGACSSQVSPNLQVAEGLRQGSDLLVTQVPAMEGSRVCATMLNCIGKYTSGVRKRVIRLVHCTLIIGSKWAE